MKMNRYVILREVQLVQIIEDHADFHAVPAADRHFRVVFAGVINDIVSLMQRDEQISVKAILKLHVLQLIVLQVQPLNRFPVASRILVNFHLAVPGLIDKAVPGDINPQPPVSDLVSAVVIKGFVDGLADQIHRAFLRQREVPLQPAAGAVFPIIDFHIGAAASVVSVNGDNLAVKMDQNLNMHNEHHQHDDKQNNADSLEKGLIFHPYPSV